MVAYGEGRPCPPWAIGVRVWPGPDFARSGCGSQDVVVGRNNVTAHVLGITKLPDAATLQEWARYVVMAAEEGWALDGGWAPYRSLWVEWGPQVFRPAAGPMYYYKAADNGAFDCCYSPAQDPVRAKDAMYLFVRTNDDWKDRVYDELVKYMRTHEPNHKTHEVSYNVMRYMQHATMAIHDMVRKAVAEDECQPEILPGAYLRPFPASMILALANDIGDEKYDDEHKVDRAINFDNPSEAAPRLRRLKRFRLD